jgi:oligoendopeptidase F
MADMLSVDEAALQKAWRLEDIYPSIDVWEADAAELAREVENVSAWTGRLGEGGAILEALRARDRVLALLMKVGGYGRLRYASDATSEENLQLAARAGMLFARAQEALAFLEPEIVALPAGTIARTLAAEPGLEPYRAELELLAAKGEHVLSAETEATLAALGEALNAPGGIHDQIHATLPYEEIEDEQGRQQSMSLARYYFGFALSPDREVRRRAYETLMAPIRMQRTALAGTLIAAVKRDVALARVRGYPSTAAMFLEPQGVPEAVYHNVVDTIHRAVSPHVQRLLRLRARVVGEQPLRIFDMSAPLVAEDDSPLSWEKGADLLMDALAPFGEEYGRILRTALHDRWVDRGDTPGRAAVPFCSPVYGVHPYVLTEWADRRSNLFALAHEIGHAVHFALADAAQLPANGSPGSERIVLFIEVPSRVNELMLTAHLLAHEADPGRRAAINLHLLDNLMTSLRTTMLGAHLERRLHRAAEAGEPITLPSIMAMEGEVFEGFFGDTLAIDDDVRLYWAQWPHYYAGTYSFTYPAGMICAHAIAEAVRTEGQPAAERFLRSLRAGASLPVLELVRMACVDLASREPIERFGAFFGRMVDEVEAAFSAVG